MSFLNGSIFRSIVRSVLFISLSWLILIGLLRNNLEPSVFNPIFTLLFWVTAMAGIFAIATSSKASSGHKPRTKTWKASASIEILSAPEEVWWVLHQPQYVPLILPIVKRSFLATDTSSNSAPQQVMIADGLDGEQIIWLVETVEERPFTSFVMKETSGTGLTHFRLDTTSGGTLLTVTAASAYLRFAAHRVHPNKELANAIETFVEAIKRVVESLAVQSATQPNPSHGSSHQPTQPPPTWTTPPNTPPPYNRPNPANPT